MYVKAMTIRHIEIFVKVAECGKMSEAARRMNISQSSVSQAISDIESEYKIRLFERLSKSLYLTPVGEGFLNYARHFLSLQNSIHQYLLESGGIKDIRIGATLTVGTCVINTIISYLKQKNLSCRPDVFVDNTCILEDKLMKSELDIALVEGKILNANLVTIPVIKDTMVLICGAKHPFWGKKVIHIKDLENQDLIMREKGSGTRAQLEEQLISSHIPYHIRWTCHNTEAIKNAVMSNEGISIISERLIRKEYKQKKLWACTIKEFLMQRSFDIVYHVDKFQFDIMKDFITACQEFSQTEQEGQNMI